MSSDAPDERSEEDVVEQRLVRGLRVIRRQLLVSGSLCEGPLILVDEEQSRTEQIKTLWHEVVHLLRDAGRANQDDDAVEDAGAKLTEVCPEIIDWVFPANA